MDEKHLFWHAFVDLPTWQKAAIVVTSLMIAPFMALIATATALSLLPLVLLGRWEGDHGPAPLTHEVTHAAKSVTRRAANFFG